MIPIPGERGPTGDHGQTGDRGLIGPTGEDGADGPRGRQGFPGAPAPRQHPAVIVLLTISRLAGLFIVASALLVALRAGQEEDRLVRDRDALRAEVAAMRAEDELERESDACYEALTNEIAEIAQETRSLSTRMEAGIVRGLITELDEPALLELAELADEAARADEAATDRRNAWLEAGRPLPCPINVVPASFRYAATLEE